MEGEGEGEGKGEGKGAGRGREVVSRVSEREGRSVGVGPLDTLGIVRVLLLADRFRDAYQISATRRSQRSGCPLYPTPATGGGGRGGERVPEEGFVVETWRGTVIISGGRRWSTRMSE